MVLVCGIAGACHKDEDPVDVRFDGIDVSGSPRTLPSVAPLPSQTSSTGVKRVPTAPVPGGGGISGCCLALSANARRAKDDGTRVVNEQAAKVCYAKSKQVAEGKLSKSDALAQVRATLLHEAPAACR
jgi:hypothetical protein